MEHKSSNLPSFKLLKRDLDKYEKVEGKIPYEFYLDNPNADEESKDDVYNGDSPASIMVDKVLDKNVEGIETLVKNYFANI